MTATISSEPQSPPCSMRVVLALAPAERRNKIRLARTRLSGMTAAIHAAGLNRDQPSVTIPDFRVSVKKMTGGR